LVFFFRVRVLSPMRWFWVMDLSVLPFVPEFVPLFWLGPPQHPFWMFFFSSNSWHPLVIPPLPDIESWVFLRKRHHVPHHHPPFSFWTHGSCFAIQSGDPYVLHCPRFPLTVSDLVPIFFFFMVFLSPLFYVSFSFPKVLVFLLTLIVSLLIHLVTPVALWISFGPLRILGPVFPPPGLDRSLCSPGPSSIHDPRNNPFSPPRKRLFSSPLTFVHPHCLLHQRFCWAARRFTRPSFGNYFSLWPPLRRRPRFFPLLLAFFGLLLFGTLFFSVDPVRTNVEPPSPRVFSPPSFFFALSFVFFLLTTPPHLHRRVPFCLISPPLFSSSLHPTFLSLLFLR